MLYQRLLLLLPSSDPAISSAWYLAFALAGLVLLLTGARLSQGIITLACVFAGAVAGKLMPGFTGIKLDPMATTVAFAFVTGVFGYLACRWLTGLLFSLLIALWTALGFWMAATSPTRWVWPDLPNQMSEVLPYLQALKTPLGPELTSQVAPFVAVSLLAALALYTMLPRLATALCWSLAGLTLAIISGLSYIHFNNSRFAANLPTTVQGQTLLVGLCLLAGVVIQSAPKRRPAAEAPPAPPMQPAMA